MDRSLPELIAAMEESKQVVSVTAWRPLDTKCELGSGLEISGIVQDGISFRARCKADLPDESVSLMLFTDTKVKPRAFARIDWRGSVHDNTNKRFSGSEWGKSAGRTHFHDPRLHLHIDYDALFLGTADLPVARKIDPEPQNFSQLVKLSGRLFNITNLAHIPEPPWPDTASLF